MTSPDIRRSVRTVREASLSLSDLLVVRCFQEGAQAEHEGAKERGAGLECQRCLSSCRRAAIVRVSLVQPASVAKFVMDAAFRG